MTEKRFTSERTDDYNFSDILDNGEWIGICHIDSADDFVKKFNELAEENEELKIQIDDVNNESIGYEEQIEKLLKKNERLKKERNHFEKKKTEYLTEWNNCRIQNTELKKDNQELKEAMKRMMIEMMGGKND